MPIHKREIRRALPALFSIVIGLANKDLRLANGPMGNFGWIVLQ